MARHMRNGRDYSRPGPKVDYELRKDSNNAARSGEVYDKIEEIQSHLKDNGKSFIFGYHMVINLKLTSIALCFQY